MRILVLPRYGYQGASSRYRFYQYLPWLGDDMELTVVPLLSDEYVDAFQHGDRRNLPAIVGAYANRIQQLITMRGKFDLIWLQIEALPWVPYWVEQLLQGSDTPYVVDYDDAWFHRYDRHRLAPVRMLLGTKVDQVMRNARLVVAGNEYLATRARNAGAPWVEIIPTVIDLDRYPLRSSDDFARQGEFCVGWIGSPSTARYLSAVEPALQQLNRRAPVCLKTVGAGNFALERFPLENKPWLEAAEVADIHEFDVGIMPLADSLWERGKCGFKLIQYMACNLPVVASPVGVNEAIVATNTAGFLAATTADWIAALATLQANPALRQTMGANGRSAVENQYCLQVTAPCLKQLLAQAAHSA